MPPLTVHLQLPLGVAPSWLFFGCRREDEDFLYKDDLMGFKRDRTLTRLEVAFSRAQAAKVSVLEVEGEIETPGI